MKQPILELKNITTMVNQQTNQPVAILQNLNLAVYPGDFITVLGTNGAGKSTLFETIAGNIVPTYGKIKYHQKDITQWSVTKRTRFLSQVFQDPKLGTAPRMTVAENLLLAAKRGQHRGFHLRKLKSTKVKMIQSLQQMQHPLIDKLDLPTENLSGGQRQSLSFLMATLNQPEILLLDEHTAALDPKSSMQLMAQTAQKIAQEHLTCLMITHHLEDALKYGNRLIILQEGQVVLDLSQAQKSQLTKEQLAGYFI
ncbi:ATP-binding cassette domain-containing protein [Bombilactobacillus folatiphilus]|uniref:ATP-binding cassette domain-containing protein n=1 Tax=Bombilactobacillus folatiphilus TaxID=2923362 RepID=A0ABY4PB31_9LACO|nr:ATP-binding cassette domain-containing protein [Bombilactobacillus folatiphilus]UQS82892.1 ATP-binding cassette domain-containing protein [Bombilactobacillus folatiphilus]